MQPAEAGEGRLPWMSYEGRCATRPRVVQMRGEIVDGFPEYIQQLAGEVQAAAAQGVPPHADGVSRRDFTGTLALAIDDATTQDVDDAVSIEELAEGGWRVHVHVSDPTEHVASGGALDLEAMQRWADTHGPT